MSPSYLLNFLSIFCLLFMYFYPNSICHDKPHTVHVRHKPLLIGFSIE